MRKLILISIVLGLNSFINCQVYGQLSEDSLKNICKTNYKLDVTNTGQKYLQTQMERGNLIEKTEEIFKDYFKSIKIFIVDYELIKQEFEPHGHFFYPYIYIVNSFTGEQVSFRSYDLFNDLINSARTKVTNLDRCYLYLLNTYEREGLGLTDPNSYKSTINSNSIFLLAAKSRQIFKSNYGQAWRAYYGDEKMRQVRANIRELISGSNRDNIYVSITKLAEACDTVYCYSFKFEKDNLKEVSLVRFQ